MKNLSILSIIIILLCFAGCKKELEKEFSNSTMEPSLLNLSNVPTVNGDRLQFNSWAQYEKYLVDLENEVNLPTTTDEDSVLFQIEQNELGGFYSLRQHLNILTGFTTDGHWIDEDLEYFSEELDNMEDNACDMIGDCIEKSTINQYYEFQINDSVYIHYNEGQILRIHESEIGHINELRAMEKCTEIPDWIYFFDEITIFTNGLTENITHGNCVQHGAGGYLYVQETAFSPGSSCNSLSMKVSFESIYQNGGISPGKFPHTLLSYRVDWGDGPGGFTSVHNSDMGSLNHTYASPGTYTIGISTLYTDHGGMTIGNADCLAKTVIVEDNCKGYSKVEFDRVEDNDYRMSYNFTIKSVRHDGQKIRHSAWSRSWKKRNNGRWRKKRLSKTVTMKGDIRNASCTSTGYPINEHKPNGIWPGKKHTLYVRKKSKWTSGGVKLSNGENNSNHTLLNRFNETFTAMPCP